MNDCKVNNVILIEDDVTLCTLIKIKLEERGINLIYLNNENDVYEYFINNSSPALIVIDYELVGITGNVIIDNLKRQGINFPFIAITGAGNEEVAALFLRLGAEDYVIKDLGFINNLENSVLKALRSFSLQIEVNEQKKLIVESEHRYRMIFENIHDIYLLLDNKFQIKEISPSIETLLQIPSGMLINQPVTYIILKKEEWKHALKKIIKEGSIKNEEITLCNKSKNIIKICQVNAKIIEFSEKKCAVVTLRDITELKKLQLELISVTSKTEEKEKKEISENIHDEVAPIFASSKMFLERAFDYNKSENERKEIFKEAVKMIDNGIQSLRYISSNLRSQVLSEFGLEKTLMRYIDQVSKASNIKFSFYYKSDKSRFEYIIENTIYKSITELIHNSIKHSQANKISIVLEMINSDICILYRDDGIGFDLDEKINSNLFIKNQGLYLMINRIKVIDGKIFFKRLEKGIEFRINIPLS